MAAQFTIRRARSSDADEISRLIAIFAAEALMLKRTPGMVELAIDDYVVATDARGHIVGCGALKEYSPSVAEVAAIAVSRDVHGCGVGRAIVDRGRATRDEARHLRRLRANAQPEFFTAIGYQRVDRARYPEKIRRDCLACSRRFACNEICFAKNLRIDHADVVITSPELEHAIADQARVAA
jgi:N-acetylglutamate synthase-like GNAT family acetyltransferase